MKSIILIGLLAISCSAFSQGNTNQKAIEHQKTLGYFGSFNYDIGDNKHINVNYSFMPLEPTTTVSYLLHTPTPRPLSFKIVNVSGKVVAEWQPAEPKYLNKGTLDVSDLKAGKYEYRIYWGKELAKSIPFTKK